MPPGRVPGGEVVDVRGPAREVAERMGVLASIREKSTNLRGMSVVDEDGREVLATTERTASGGELDSPDLEILRDGLHSITRRLVFGPEEEYLRYLGRHLAVWTAPNHLGLDRWQMVCQMRDADLWGAMVMSVRDNTEVRVLGDAGYCGSPASGQGTSMALAVPGAADADEVIGSLRLKDY